MPETIQNQIKPDSSSAMKWAAPLALIPALAGFSIAGESAPEAAPRALEPDHRAAVVEFGTDAWKAVQPAVLEQEEVSARHWNDLQAAMLAADNGGIHEIQPIREAIINAGVTNPEIPARVVHAALYSSAEYVGQMARIQAPLNTEIREIESFIKAAQEVEGDALPEGFAVPARLRENARDDKAELLEKAAEQVASLREQSEAIERRMAATGSSLSKAAIPFLGKVIVDSESSTGVSTRALIPADQASRFSGKEGITLYNPDGFEQLASYVIGRTGTKAEFDLVFSELKRTDLRTERAEMLFDVFLHAGDRQVANGLTGHIHEILFRAPAESREEGLRLRMVEGVPTIIAVPPTDKMRKALAPLERVDGELLRQTISDPFSTDPAEQMAYARGMLYLAKQNHPAALPAVGQWFTLRATRSSVADGVDEVMREALGELSTESKEGFNLMLHVAAGNADIMAYMLEAPLAIENTAEHRAGRNYITALRMHPDDAKQWIIDVADGRAETLLPTPTTRAQRDSRQDLNQATRTKALEMMAYLDTRGTFVEYMTAIVENPFAGSRTTSDMRLAITGLAMQKDADSVPLLLKKSADPALSESLRGLALAAALEIDTPDIVPEATRQAVGIPFSHANLLKYAPEYNHETGERLPDGDVTARIDALMASENPFEGRVIDRYADWLSRTQAQIKGAENSGQFPDELSREDRLQAYLELERQETGRSGSLFSVLRTDPELYRTVAKPLVDYLKLHQDTRRHIDISDAQRALEVLSRAGITDAQEVVLEMVRNPKLFASEDMSQQSGFMLSMQASSIMQLKASAIEALGGVVDLNAENDAAAEVLHTVARKETSRTFRDAALAGLNRLADRYEAALATDGSDTATLTACRNAHGVQATAHLLHHAQGLDETGQIRLRSLDRNFANARAADRLGGTVDLILAANKAAGEDLAVFRVNSGSETDISLRPDIVRSIMHAMISNGKTVADLQGLEMDADQRKLGISLFQFVDNEVYWLGEEGEKRYTGEGTNIVVLDAGYVYDVPMVKGLGERVLYPEGLEGYDPVQRLDFESAHPTAVAATAHEKAPDATIHSYNAWGGLREVPFRPEDVQGEVIRALEHIVERQVLGEVDFDAINYSFSYRNYALANDAFREELLDLTGAYIDLASAVGIKHSISAGNSRGDSPSSARYGGLGEVNSLGLRFSDDKKYEQPDGVFIAGAQDAYAGARLAEFTSSGDALKPENGLRVISFDGTNVLLPWVDGKWILMPINGTSFAAPNQEAMFAWADEAFEKAGVNPTMEEWRDLMNNSKIEMPHYEDYEGGSYFHVATFMKEITRVIERHR